MARATGLAPRRGYEVDREMVLLGAVAAGPRGEAAETRTGSARLLTSRLDAQNVFKCVLFGQTSNVSGGYLVQVAHVAEGSTTPGTYVTAGIIEGSGTTTVELALSGKDIAEKVAAVSSGEVRTIAVRLTAGTGSNGAAVPAGTMTIALMPVE